MNGKSIFPDLNPRELDSKIKKNINSAPGGNLLEGQPWEGYTVYAQYELCSNNNNIYVCVGTGTSAGSGGPSGTGTNIIDGGVTWNYVMPARMSVFASGTSGTNTPATGITFSGSLASGFTMLRVQGSASGTITESIESPWSNNQTGQRQVITFSLGGGDHNELWEMIVGPVAAYSAVGIRPSDLGVTPFFAEAEIELSSVANLEAVYLHLIDVNGSFNAYDGYFGPEGGSGTLGGTGMQMMASSGEMLAIPNSGKLSLRTQPMILPPNLVDFTILIRWIFDTSGGAGSATATNKINYVGIRRWGVA